MEQFQVSRHFAKIVILIHATFMAVVLLSNIFGPDSSRPPATNATTTKPADSSAAQVVSPAGVGAIAPVAFTGKAGGKVATTVYRVSSAVTGTDIKYVSADADGHSVRISCTPGHGKFVVLFDR